MNLPPLDWGGGRVRLECAFLGRIHRFEHDGPFARIGSDPRCEFCIPGLPAPVCVYLQFGKHYVAVLELVESNPASLCEPVYAMPGATVWLQPNARITVESLQVSDSKQESFSWENFNVEDVRVFPNTLVARTGFFATNTSPTHFRIQSSLSVLGSSASCQLRPEHKHISRFQAIVFRGEHQGESCRVVDLFGDHPTLVDNLPANGSVLEVGSQLRIANLQFEAVRMLYNASRPNQLVEVRSQFTTLPLQPRSGASDKTAPEQTRPEPTRPERTGPEQTAQGRAANEDRQESSKKATEATATELQSMKDRIVRAIGFDSGPTRKKGVHFPIEATQDRPSVVPEPTPVDSKLADGLDRVAKSQERIANEFEKLAQRLEGVERSLIGLPELLDNNTQHLAETVESLKEVIQQVALQPAETRVIYKEVDPGSTKPAIQNSAASQEPKQLTQSRAASDSEGNSPTPTAPQTLESTKPSSKKPDPSASKQQGAHPQQKQRPGSQRPNANVLAGKQKSETQSNSKGSGSKKESTTDKKSVSSESDSNELSWLQRAANGLSGWIPNTAAHRRAIAEREDPNNPLNLGSQATANRTRLQHHEDESERLAASESKDEALVLGSLMGLRYRDARKAFFKWLAFGLVLATLSIVGGPLVWNRIPEGWRELLWQKITFSKTQQQVEYENTYGKETDASDSDSANTKDSKPAGSGSIGQNDSTEQPRASQEPEAPSSPPDA